MRELFECLCLKQPPCQGKTVKVTALVILQLSWERQHETNNCTYKYVITSCPKSYEEQEQSDIERMRGT